MKIEEPILRIPNLAIHLTKGPERSSFAPNLQENFYPILATEVKAQLGAAEYGHGKNGNGNGNGHGNGNGNGNGNGHKTRSDQYGSKSRHHPLLLELLSEKLRCAREALLFSFLGP